MNRIDRLHAILTHLQSKKRVTAQEVADRFNISLRTVYRDIKALDESGVPVIGEAGSGYTIMEGYRLPPVMFTQEEASALLLAGKIAEQAAQGSVQKHFDSALFKIKAVLRTSDKDHVDQLGEHVAVMRPSIPVDDSGNQYLTALQKAIVDRNVIMLKYATSYNEEITERQVEPIGLFYYGFSWHLIAWCRLRNDYRDFKVSRIQRLQIREEVFQDKNHPSLKEYIDKLVNHLELKEATVIFDKEVARYLTQKYFYGFIKEEMLDSGVRMHFAVNCLENFGRWLLMYTNAIIVEYPNTLKDILKKLSHEAFMHFNGLIPTTRENSFITSE